MGRLIRSRLPASSALLGDQFTGSTVMFFLNKEVAAYSGSCIRLSRSNGTSQTDIGFSGNDIDATAADSFLAGGTAFAVTGYDQSGNGNDITFTTGKYQFLKVSTGVYELVSIDAAGSASIADAASHKTTIVDMYFVGKIGATYNDSTDYQTVVAGWMPTGDATSVARWGFILKEGGNGDGLEVCRNGVAGSRTSVDGGNRNIPIGNGQRTTLQVWHYNSNRLAVRRNDSLLWDDVTEGETSAANVTYSGTGKIMIGSNFNGTQNARMTIRGLVLYGTTRADRSSIVNYLKTRYGVSDLPTSFGPDADGFTYTPSYLTSYSLDSSDDANGMRWWYETGAYPGDGTRGPSLAIANNVSNGVPMVRFEVRANDNDTIVNGSERSERGGRIGASTAIDRGDTIEEYFVFKISAPTQSGDWSLFGQVHTDTGLTPDLMYMNAVNDVLQAVTARNEVETDQGSSTAIVQDTWYAIRRKFKFSADGLTDTYEEWVGVHGTTLTKTVDLTTPGPYFPATGETSGAYIKEGWYRGYPTNNAGAVVHHVSDHRMSKSANAFAAFVTTQPALPIHA